MSHDPTPNDQEVTIGIPYLSPTLNETTAVTRNIRKNNKTQQKNTKTNEKEQKNEAGNNTRSTALGIMDIDQDKTKNGTTGKKRSAPISPGIGTSEALDTLKLTNKEHLNEQQMEFITKFNKYQKQIECSKCKGTWLNIDRIDHIEIEDEEYAEIVLLCKKCTKKFTTAEVQELITKVTKEKKRQIGDTRVTTNDKKKTGEVKYTADVEAVMEQYERAREKISCNKCGTIGTIQKNGRNQGKPPKPQYKCKQCEKGTTFAEMKTILKYETTKKNEEQMQTDTEEKSDFEDDDENDVPDIADTEMEQDEELAGEINVWNEMKLLKKRLEKTEKETKKMQELIRENINLKKENIELKKKMREMEEENETEEYNETNNNNNNYQEENLNQSKIQDSNTNSHNEFPYLKATKSNIAQQQNNNNNNWTKRRKNQFFRQNNPTKKQLEIATRTLEEKKEDNNFINIHIPCKRRMKPSEIRKKLAYVGIDNIQVLDTYCPDWDTVLLLIHEKYKDTAEKKLEQAGIFTKEYNYLHISHLRDSKLAGLSTEEKVAKLQQIRNNCSMRALEFIREPVKKSVARCFYRQNIISEDQLKQILTGRNTNEAMDIFQEPATEEQPIGGNPEASQKTTATN
ncbi:uncharacterized protein EV154DRAFT_483764 [Mucor mucedo]|uniref:uncharacterized protein n=1 Tax=Mucor mucedo TaxID=29922 RepID=UPI002220AA67|nr:uncharacterized protein EV154DRAFT_483764 [Mucor mucedo]KAI7888814.1 hypothetical protein EV154DRAFT_483764 [Mucor mucedo]